MRPLVLAATLTFAGCGEPTKAPPGVLWQHRDQIVAALDLRRGRLSALTGKKIAPCIHYWISGDGSKAERPTPTCDQNRREVRVKFESYLGVEVTEGDMRDAMFWRYLAEHVWF